MTAPHFFWNQPELGSETMESHDGGKSLSGMSRQTKPQSSSRRISHRGHAVSIIPFQHTLRPRGHVISNTPRIQYSIHARHGFSMRDARCFASSFRIPFGTEAARFIHGHLRTYHTEPSFVSSVMRWRFMTQESLFRHDGNTFPPGTRHSICILLSYDSPSSPASRASVFCGQCGQSHVHPRLVFQVREAGRDHAEIYARFRPVGYDNGVSLSRFLCCRSYRKQFAHNTIHDFMISRWQNSVIPQSIFNVWHIPRNSQYSAEITVFRLATIA